MPPDGQWELLLTSCLLPTARRIFCSWEKRFIIVVVSPFAALMKDQVIVMSQKVIRAAYIRDAKEDAEIMKDNAPINCCPPPLTFNTGRPWSEVGIVTLEV